MAHGALRHGETNGPIFPPPGGEDRPLSPPPGEGPALHAFLISLATVAIAEIGDRTQILSLCLAAHYRKPVPILAGILVATLINHALAGFVGATLARFITAPLLDAMVGAGMVAMALWVLKPNTLAGKPAETSAHGAFLATLIAFFIAEMGDKTQIATLALAAAYPNLIAVVAGTTTGMFIANLPAVLLGDALAGKLPIRQINYVAAMIFLAIGSVFIWRSVVAWQGGG
jgi:putative Ca2+/H+ antiporter (TMEM165/GDT1 family)